MTRSPTKKTLDLVAMAQAANEEVQQAKELPPAAADVEERVKLTPREIVFTIGYDAPDGKDYSADIKSKVIDADGRLAKTRLLAQLTRGLNPDSLSQEDRYRFEALARAAVQLVEPPSWLIDAIGEDLELLISVNNILLEHENRYFRGNSRKGEGSSLKARVRTTVAAFNPDA